MSISIEEREALWTRFIERWPLVKLNQITLPEYTEAKNSDCFTYGWLEQGTENLGSIWGGSAFKFGVYSRSDQSDKINGSGKSYSTEYGWYTKYGETPEDAFKRVRAIIVQIADAAYSGNLNVIENADLGSAIKWKIAFLYQNREKPYILPIYKSEYLRLALDSTEKCVSVLQKQIMKNLSGKNIWEYYDELWTAIQQKLSAELSPKDANNFFKQSDQFKQIRPPAQKIAGYENSHGMQLALDLDNDKTTLYLKAGAWIDTIKDKLQKVVTYAADKTRSSNLAANAPQLAQGNAIVKVVIPTMAMLVEVCNAYDIVEIIASEQSSSTSNNSSMPPLNQIFYGPPGTGKTYSTIDAAIGIIDPEFLANHPEIPNSDWKVQRTRREMLIQRFKELSENKRIRFVTFHQSFSYEDFVEGIRALPSKGENEHNSGSIQYQVEKGIFGQLCEDAQRNKVYEQQIGVRENANVWKISIEESNSSGETRQYCFSHGEARIGWPIVNDIRKTDLSDPVLKLGSNEQSSLANFGRYIVPGDVLLCLKTVSQICAIGIVTGEYEYTADVPEGVRSDYVHKLPVKWLATDLKFDITELNQGNNLTLKTVYPLWRIKWLALQDALHKARVVLADELILPEASNEPYVLIIDEINRGNVSRIFGELITLIEESKRAKAEESLETLLPYSKQRFSIPKNVYLIGTMNTADRSLASLDIALRRRFAFKEMPPKSELLDDIDIDGINIGELLRTINKRVEVLLDRDHCIGHAYFMPLRDDNSLEKLASIFQQQIFPLLEEYFFEDWERIAWVLNDQNKEDNLAFIQKVCANISILFGSKTASNLQNNDRCWRINKDSFTNIESYRAIVRGNS